MTRRVRALLSRSVSRVLGWLASRSPRTAFFVSDAFALILALGAGRIRRRIGMNRTRTQLVTGWIDRDGPAPFRRLVRQNHALAQLHPPMIVGTFHIGPTRGVGALAERLNGETLVVRGAVVGSTHQQRAATFHRAIERLRSNGFVVIALDPHEAQRIAVPFLGRTLHLARGPFAMARIARVPILPVVARWDGNEIDLITGDVLPAGDERTMAEAAARWLETYLKERPGELSSRIRELMR